MRAPVCSICKKPQTLLDQPTDKGEPVFVCTIKQRRAGMPCDGWIVNVPSEQPAE